MPATTRIKSHPFVSGMSKTFDTWLASMREVLYAKLCSECDGTSESPKATWLASEVTTRLEVESRVVTLRGGIMPLSPNTVVQLAASAGDDVYRLRGGEAITKRHLSTEIVFDTGGNFVRRVASLESWPVSYYSLLLHTSAKIDWSRQRLVDCKLVDGVSHMRAMHESTIGYHEIVERESNYSEPPLYESLGHVEYESFPFFINTTHVPTRPMLKRLLADERSLYSPKVDGTRRFCSFSTCGVFMEDPKSGLVEFVETAPLGLDKLPRFLVERVAVDSRVIYVIIDVCIAATVVQRVEQINWLRRFAEPLARAGIFLQIYTSGRPGRRDSHCYEGIIVPTDGYIISPATGKTQYKLKLTWTVDLQLYRDKMIGCSGDGHRIVRLQKDLFASPVFSGDGVYECLIIDKGRIILERRRDDRTDANLIVAIFQNIDMSNMTLNEQRDIGINEWFF